MINNATQAMEAVSFAKFPPVGVRGQGGPFACYEFGYATPAEYVAVANDLVLVMVQIESVQGLQNVDEICKVDGVGGSLIACCSSLRTAEMLTICRPDIHWPERSSISFAGLCTC